MKKKATKKPRRKKKAAEPEAPAPAPRASRLPEQFRMSEEMSDLAMNTAGHAVDGLMTTIRELQPEGLDEDLWKAVVLGHAYGMLDVIRGCASPCIEYLIATVHARTRHDLSTEDTPVPKENLQ